MSKTFQREESLFHATHQLATREERLKHLEAECAGDEGLKQRVWQLIEASESANAFFLLAAPAESKTPPRPRAEPGGS